MRSLLFVLVWLLAAGAQAEEPGVTVRPESHEPWDTGRRAVRYEPGLVTEPKPEVIPLPTDTGWTLIDSLAIHCLIPAGERLAVEFDRSTEQLKDTLLPEFLTVLAKQAVAVAPDWLKDDLADNFRRLSLGTQNAFADIIVNCPDKRYYDEVCFQVAHLAPTAFLYLEPRLLVDNVETAYEIDLELSYVDIIDYGDPLQGGDYYSTTRYRAIVSGDTAEVEIPREDYYWWVMMPKITDEQVKYCYGYFWREFLFYCCDPGYPLLREKLANTTVLWDGERHNWTNRGQGYPDTLPAVAVVSRWVAHTLPAAAQPPRPIQPIEIAKDHNGNCGEVQDLLCAAARTALIPCGGVLDINEDHVWCEIPWLGEFHPWQVDLGGGPTNIKNPGIAYDRRHGGGKEVSGVWDWRNDGWQRSVVGTYSYVCTLTVEVRDSVLRPVDGAVVRILSEGWQTAELWNAFFGVTDRSGQYTTTLGDWQNYYLDITSPLGRHYAGLVIDSAGCEPETHFFYACTLDGRLDSLVVGTDSGVPLDEYRLDVTYEAGHEAVYGYDCWNASGANVYALVQVPGVLDFFIARKPEFELYLEQEPFSAFAADENASAGSHSLVLASTEDHYLVFSNQEQQNVTAFADILVRLYKRGVGIAEQEPGPENWALVAANPVRTRLEILVGPSRPEDARVSILDQAGRLVQVLDIGPRSGPCRLVWDGCDTQGRRLGAGVYFCQVSGRGRTVTRPVVFLGR